jgi:hypothetical protein
MQVAGIAFLALLPAAPAWTMGSAPSIPPLREVDSDPSWPPKLPRLRAALAVLPSLSTGAHSLILVPSLSARGTVGPFFDYVLALQARSERYGRGAGRADNIDVVWATAAMSRSVGPVTVSAFASNGTGFYATFGQLIGHAQEYGGSVGLDFPGFALGAERWSVSPSVEMFQRVSALPELRFHQVSPGIELRGRIADLPGWFRLSATADFRSYADGRRDRIVTLNASWGRVVARNLAVGLRAEYARNTATPRGNGYASFEFGPFLIMSFSTAPSSPREDEDMLPGRRRRF